MKGFKFICSMLLVVAMVFGSSVSALAASNVKINMNSKTSFTISQYEKVERVDEWETIYWNDIQNDYNKVYNLSNYISSEPITLTFQGESGLLVGFANIADKSYETHTYQEIRFTYSDGDEEVLNNEGSFGNHYLPDAKDGSTLQFALPGTYYLFYYDEKNAENVVLFTIKGNSESTETNPNTNGSNTPPATKKPADNTADVVLNGETLSLSPTAKIVNGSTFVPLRGVLEHMGARIWWEGKKKLITIETESHVVELTVGSTIATVNGEKITLTIAPFFDGNYTYVPLRFLSQSIGAKVDWDQTTATVIINTK